MTTTTKYTVGDSVVCNGYLGTVSALTDYGMIEVGGVCVDPNDTLTVQPGFVWDVMCKAAQSDMRKARKEGSILIADTRRGLVELRYNAPLKSYEVRTQGVDSRFIMSASTVKSATQVLASLNQVEVA